MHVPIHNHSEYSGLDGLSKMEEIAQRCVDLGCPCCGLTDHHTVAGHLEFGKVMNKHGIKPIYGCEVYLADKPWGFDAWGKQERDQSHFVVGALNNTGLRNLWRLVDASAPNFRFVSRVTPELMRTYSDGLFATSACMGSLSSQAILNDGDPYQYINEWADIFRDNFYIELHTYPGEEHQRLNLALAQIATERGFPVIYADDAHFAYPEQYELHDAYLVMQTGKPKKGEQPQTIYTPVEDRKMWHPKSLYIKSEAEIRAALSYLPEQIVNEAIRNSAELGEKCNAELPEVRTHLPVFIPKECPWVTEEQKELTAAELFMELVEKGVHSRYGEDPAPEVWERITHECGVYLNESKNVRLYDYMLMGWDLVSGYCASEDIEVGPGRGSSAGSIVAYCLGITDVDPLHYDLIFERFWNDGRADGFPDIDMDFPRAARRKKILPYLERRYGKDKVRPIGTIGRMKPKAAVDKTYKACAITFDEARELKTILSDVPDIEIHGTDQIGWSRETEPGKVIYVDEHVGDKIADWIKGKPQGRQPYLEMWLILLQHLCSRISHRGVHPSGVVVSDVNLSDELPGYWNKDEELTVTMFPMDDVDKRKFVKLDVLGLRTLDTLTMWKKTLKEEQDIEIDWSNLERGEFPEEMWEMFDKGMTLGLFQVEDAPAVRRLVKEYKPRSVQELSVIVALNRPGPLRSKPAGANTKAKTSAEQFLWRKLGKEPVEYEHPFLEDILKETQGIFLYQEQIIALFNKLGYSLSDSDAIRKIMGKKKPEQLKAVKEGTGEWEGKGFMDIAPKFMGDKAESVWNTIEGFASYCFNKSHSVCYGTITFRTNFAKYFGSTEFEMACVITDTERIGKHVAEARRMQIEVFPPDILLSKANMASDEDGNLRYGFADVKGLRGDSAEFLVELRDKYGSMLRTRVGLEEALAIEKKDWEARKKQASLEFIPFSEKSPNQRLQSNKIDALQDAGAFDAYEPSRLPMRTKQEKEKELLGVILTDDTAQAFMNNSDLIAECDSFEELNDPWNGEDMWYNIPGVVTGIRETQTKKDGKAMGIVTVEFEGEEAEFAVFPKQWRSSKFLWKERTPGIFKLCKTERGYFFQQGTKLT